MVCAVGPEVNPHMVSLLYPVERNIRAVATALNKPVRCCSLPFSFLLMQSLAIVHKAICILQKAYLAAFVEVQTAGRVLSMCADMYSWGIFSYAVLQSRCTQLIPLAFRIAHAFLHVCRASHSLSHSLLPACGSGNLTRLYSFAGM